MVASRHCFNCFNPEYQDSGLTGMDGQEMEQLLSWSSSAPTNSAPDLLGEPLENTDGLTGIVQTSNRPCPINRSGLLGLHL